MNKVKWALQIMDDELPVQRNLNSFEVNEIYETAKKKAKTLPGGFEGNLVILAIEAAYNYGFWQGWKHCEVERPEFEDSDVDEETDSFEACDHNTEVTTE